MLYLELSRHFGPELVFLDNESIPAGADFTEHLVDRVRRACAVLAVIGPAWLPMTRPRRRLQIRSATDWTARELTEALAAGIPVIPVITDGADMPSQRELPACLTQLSRCQYRRLRCRDFRTDLDRIITDLTVLDTRLRAVAVARRSITMNHEQGSPAVADGHVTTAVEAALSATDRPRTAAKSVQVPRMPAQLKSTT
jgi:hypothetical protein